MMMHGKKSGFTLIELMIVVAIIGIIAAIAYPSYIDSIRKTRFAQAKEGAMEVSTALERAVAQSSSYPVDLTGISQPYNNDKLAYTYLPTDADANGNRRGYKLTVVEKTARFGIWAGINSTNTHCGCDGKVCTATTAGTFSADQVSCTSPTEAF